MSPDRSNPPRGMQPPPETEQVISGVLELVNTALGVGATVAKTVAQETAGGKPVPAPTHGDSALNVMVHYGVTAVSNVMGLVISGTGVSTQTGQPTPTPNQAPRPSEDAPAPPAMANLPSASPNPTAFPTVHPGASLRIPLSIQNPTAEPIMEMAVTCLTVEAAVTGDGELLPVSALTLQPTTLTIAPQDFEKLTVWIETQPTTAPGVYRAVLGMGPENFETVLQFQVVTDPE